MRKATTQPGLLLAALAACAALSACGSSKPTSGTAAAPGPSKPGGAVTIAFSEQPDSLDPALGTGINSAEINWLVYTPLLTYPHQEGIAGTKLVPGLAQGLPVISKDGLTYTLQLKKDLTYSDRTLVKASDFEHAIKRVLIQGSSWAPLVEPIAGAKEYEQGKKPDADISGITSDDASGRITIKLTEPHGDFAYVLAFPFASPVPARTAVDQDLSKSPPPGVGPYRVTSNQPNRQIVMEKTPGFSVPGIDRGHLDRITAKIVPSLLTEAQQVLSNKLDYMDDPPPTDILRRVRAEARDRFKTVDTISTYYMFLNVKAKPFNDIRVRQAVNYALDKRAIQRLYGGLLTPGCTFLPKGMLGHVDYPCPYGDPTAAPNLARAKQLVKESHTAGQKITVWGTSQSPTDKVVQYYADVLDSLGYKATPKVLDGPVYASSVGSQKVNAQTGFANWSQDYPHPADFMQLIETRSIQPQNSQNLGNTSDPAGIDKPLAKLAREPDLAKVASQYGAIDRYAVEKAYLAPYGQRQVTVFQSARMNFGCAKFHPLYSNDFSSWCLK